MIKQLSNELKKINIPKIYVHTRDTSGLCASLVDHIFLCGYEIENFLLYPNTLIIVKWDNKVNSFTADKFNPPKKGFTEFAIKYYDSRYRELLKILISESESLPEKHHRNTIETPEKQSRVLLQGLFFLWKF